MFNFAQHAVNWDTSSLQWKPTVRRQEGIGLISELADTPSIGMSIRHELLYQVIPSVDPIIDIDI